MTSATKPITYQADLAKLPRALVPLLERRQWAVWRWTRAGDRWSKPPFQARNPQQQASVKDPGTWSDYATALATVQAGHADGLTYVDRAGRLRRARPDLPMAPLKRDPLSTGPSSCWDEHCTAIARSRHPVAAYASGAPRLGMRCTANLRSIAMPMPRSSSSAVPAKH